jgi:hypothetical protein
MKANSILSPFVLQQPIDFPSILFHALNPYYKRGLTDEILSKNSRSLCI